MRNVLLDTIEFHAGSEQRIKPPELKVVNIDWSRIQPYKTLEEIKCTLKVSWREFVDLTDPCAEAVAKARLRKHIARDLYRGVDDKLWEIENLIHADNVEGALSVLNELRQYCRGE